MEEQVIINREELFSKIKEAKLQVRILGAVSFDLPYEDFRNDWYERIDKGKFQVEIICESESDLNYSSLISANRKVSGQSRSYNIGSFLRIKNEAKIKVRDFLANKNCKHIEPKGENPERDENGNPKKEMKNGEEKFLLNKDEEQCFSLRTCYWRIPIPTINIDGDFYYTLSLTKFCTQDKFEKITIKNAQYDEFQKYFHAYFSANLGAKKFSSEITTKDNRTETILMYNDNRQCLGQLPRTSFLDITKAKVVIWGMIFTRDGRVLIHKRGENAKDNRAMWDKSIGGHVDMEIDTVDTVKAAAREMLEELYKIEKEDQGGHTAIEVKTINPDIPIFLGEWREEMRRTLPFKEIKKNKEEIYFFRMNYDFSKNIVDSPRILPNGKESPVKCFADVYVFIMNEHFDENVLQNSSFKLLELYELNDCYQGDPIEYIHKNTKVKISEPFIATPDLRKILTGELMLELTAFGDYLKEGLNSNE